MKTLSELKSESDLRKKATEDAAKSSSKEKKVSV